LALIALPKMKRKKRFPSRCHVSPCVKIEPSRPASDHHSPAPCIIHRWSSPSPDTPENASKLTAIVSSMRAQFANGQRSIGTSTW
jgi:hypothetical protein